jgi:hypothetical protein
MTYLVIFNGLTAMRIISLIAMRQTVYLIDVDSQIVGVKHLINLLARYFLIKGWLRTIEELGMSLDQETRLRKIAQPGDWHQKAEPAMLEQLHLAKQIKENEIYDYAAQKQAAKYGDYYLAIYRYIKRILEEDSGIPLKIVSGNNILQNICEIMEPMPKTIGFENHRTGTWLANILLSIAVVLFSWGRLVRLFRIKRSPRKPVFMAVDLHDGIDLITRLMDDILDDPKSETLYVFRNKFLREKMSTGLPPDKYCTFGDGQFSGIDFACSFFQALLHGFQLFRRFGHTPPTLYLSIAKLNYIRLGYKGLFNKYDITYFFGRDQYNSDHIIRSQELRKRNGTSLGLINGINVFGWDISYRFIDFDRTYVHSRGPLLKYNSDNWRHPNGIRQIGAIKLSRADIKGMMDIAKTRDIVCFAKNYCDGAIFLDELFKVARALPDKQIYISLKKSSMRLEGVEEFVSYLAQAPKNIELVDDFSFDLIKRHSFIISGESSILSEAISLGCYAFFLDTYTDDIRFIYREYPEMSHRDGNEIAERIKGIDNKTWNYPIAQMKDLGDTSGWISFDAIRRDIGLDPKDSKILAGLWDTK